MKRLRGRNGIPGKVGMFAAHSDNTNVAHTSMHCYCKQDTLPPSFITKQETTHEQNGTWTVSLWFLGGWLVCSSNINHISCNLRLPSIKLIMSTLRPFTKTSFCALGWKCIDTCGLPTDVSNRSDKQNEMNRDEDYLWHECNGTNKITNRLWTKKCNQHLLNEVKRTNTK